MRWELGHENTVVIAGLEDPKLYPFSEEHILSDQGLDHLKHYSIHSKYRWYYYN